MLSVDGDHPAKQIPPKEEKVLSLKVKVLRAKISRDLKTQGQFEQWIIIIESLDDTSKDTFVAELLFLTYIIYAHNLIKGTEWNLKY